MPRTAPPLALPVYPVITAEDWTFTANALTNRTGDRILARTVAEARRACRAAGYRVRIAYGLTETAEVEAPPCIATGERRTERAWLVTVHPIT